MINYKYNLSDKICGDSIIGRAGTIHERVSKRKKNVQLKELEFFQSAECVMNPPITTIKELTGTKVLIEGLRGKKIHGESKHYSKIAKVKKTGSHTQQQTILRGSAKCIVMIPITSRRSP